MVDGEKEWLYAAIGTESTCSAAVGLIPRWRSWHRLTEEHETDETEFLVNAGGYLTSLARHDLSGQLNYSEQNHVESGFRRSQCGSTAFTPSGGAVQPAHAAS